MSKLGDEFRKRVQTEVENREFMASVPAEGESEESIEENRIQADELRRRYGVSKRLGDNWRERMGKKVEHKGMKTRTHSPTIGTRG